jgi:rod shape determining protein RodA
MYLNNTIEIVLISYWVVDLKGIIIRINLKLLSDLEDGSEGVFSREQTKEDLYRNNILIFTTVGEEWGFVGALVVITLFTTLFLRVIYLAETKKQNLVVYMAGCNIIHALL